MNINSISALVHKGVSYFVNVGPTGWFVGFVVTLLVGIVCLRGFGSRSSY